jgi:hypothetical protein
VTDLADCGCCQPPDTRASVHNRAGLTALSYRVGTYGTFLRRMLGRLPVETIADGENGGTRPLAGLTTRSTDDGSIALLDACAVVADVLTFYQERIANEGFLATATERRSVLELARAIGYELAPGVAASAHLAFIVEKPAVVPADVVPPEQRGFQGAPGTNAPTTAIVPAGLAVQSIPGPGELPRAFETAEDLEARVDWNAIRPRLTHEQPFDPDAKTIWVEGTATGIEVGSRLLFLERKPDDTIDDIVRTVANVIVEDRDQRTRVDLAGATGAFVYVPISKALLTFAIPVIQKAAFSKLGVQQHVLGASWKQKDLTSFVSMQKWQGPLLTSYLAGLIKKKAKPPQPSFALDTPVQSELHVMAVRAAAFGHNAPRWASLPKNRDGTDPVWSDWDSSPRSIAQNSSGADYDGAPGGLPSVDFWFDRAIKEVRPGGWIVIENGASTKVVRAQSVTEASLADYAMSGRATGVIVQDPNGGAVSAADLSSRKTRTTTLWTGNQALALARLPIEEPIGAGTEEVAQLTLDGLVLGLAIGRPIAITGERHDLPGVYASEIAVLADIVHDKGLTTFFFEAGLTYTYVRATVTLNANVVLATHGETVHEVLGSGDAATPNQRFRLKRPPLTHVAADSPSGAESTLDVRVDGVLWDEQPSLYGVAPDRRAFIIRIEDDATAAVTFGDGVQGARLPTGTANVLATYRTGIGLGGEVAAGSLTILQTKPLGIREVTNPVAAAGAEDPETLAGARTAAPLTVRTLDRIVSLQDHADFARNFAGVGKADARPVWDGRGRRVIVTIGAASGEPVDENGVLAGKLAAAMTENRAPLEAFVVRTFQPLFFDIEAGVLVEAAYDAAIVLEAIEAALLDAFRFETRDFGQPVTAAEVVATIHSVEGVIAADLDALHLVTDAEAGTSLASILEARPARYENGAPALAELLLVNPAGIALREMTP